MSTKILIYNDLVFGGGVENVLYNIVSYLAQKEYSVTVIGTNATKKEFYAQYPQTVRYINFEPFRPKSDNIVLKLLHNVFKKIFKLANLIRFNIIAPDIAISMKEGATTRYISHIRAARKFAWVHTDYRHMYWTKTVFKTAQAELNCMKRFDRIVCISDAVKVSLINTIGDPKNLCVRYNPINVDSIILKSKETPEYDFCDDKLTIVSVGRLSAEKNYKMLINVCNRLSEKYDLKLLIIGDGKERDNLKDQIDKSKSKNIILLGYKDNPYPYIYNADFYVSASMVESYGLAIQEALILGKPVVAVRCPAIEEVFDERFGILADNNEEALYYAVESMIIDSEMRLTFESNITHYYDKSSLYVNRIKDICQLWEQ